MAEGVVVTELRLETAAYDAGAKAKVEADKRMVEAAAKVDVALADSQRKVGGYSDSFDKFLRQHDAAYRVQQQFAGQQERLNRLLERGKISAEEHAAGLEVLRAKFKQVDDAAKPVEASGDRIAGTLGKIGGAAQGMESRVQGAVRNINDIKGTIELLGPTGEEAARALGTLGGFVGNVADAFGTLALVAAKNPLILLAAGALTAGAAIYTFTRGSNEAAAAQKNLGDVIERNNKLLEEQSSKARFDEAAKRAAQQSETLAALLQARQEVAAAEQEVAKLGTLPIGRSSSEQAFVARVESIRAKTGAGSTMAPIEDAAIKKLEEATEKYQLLEAQYMRLLDVSGRVEADFRATSAGAEAAAKAYNALQLQLDPTAAAIAKLSGELRIVNEAERLGMTTAADAAQARERLIQAFDAETRKVEGLNKVYEALDLATRRATEAAQADEAARAARAAPGDQYLAPDRARARQIEVETRSRAEQFRLAKVELDRLRDNYKSNDAAVREAGISQDQYNVAVEQARTRIFGAAKAIEGLTTSYEKLDKATRDATEAAQADERARSPAASAEVLKSDAELANRLTRESFTAQEKFNEQLAIRDRLLAQSSITQETYNRQVEKLNQDLRESDPAFKAAQQAAERHAKEIERIIGRSADRVVDFGADAIFRRLRGENQNFWEEFVEFGQRAFAQVASETLLRQPAQWALSQAFGIAPGLFGAQGGGVQVVPNGAGGFNVVQAASNANSAFNFFSPESLGGRALSWGASALGLGGGATTAASVGGLSTGALVGLPLAEGIGSGLGAAGAITAIPIAEGVGAGLGAAGGATGALGSGTGALASISAAAPYIAAAVAAAAIIYSIIGGQKPKSKITAIEGTIGAGNLIDFADITSKGNDPGQRQQVLGVADQLETFVKSLGREFHADFSGLNVGYSTHITNGKTTAANFLLRGGAAGEAFQTFTADPGNAQSLADALAQLQLELLKTGEGVSETIKKIAAASDETTEAGIKADLEFGKAYDRNFRPANQLAVEIDKIIAETDLYSAKAREFGLDVGRVVAYEDERTKALIESIAAGVPASQVMTKVNEALVELGIDGSETGRHIVDLATEVARGAAEMAESAKQWQSVIGLFVGAAQGGAEGIRAAAQAAVAAGQAQFAGLAHFGLEGVGARVDASGLPQIVYGTPGNGAFGGTGAANEANTLAAGTYIRNLLTDIASGARPGGDITAADAAATLSRLTGYSDYTLGLLQEQGNLTISRSGGLQFGDPSRSRDLAAPYVNMTGGASGRDPFQEPTRGGQSTRGISFGPIQGLYYGMYRRGPLSDSLRIDQMLAAGRITPGQAEIARSQVWTPVSGGGYRPGVTVVDYNAAIAQAAADNRLSSPRLTQLRRLYGDYAEGRLPDRLRALINTDESDAFLRLVGTPQQPIPDGRVLHDPRSGHDVSRNLTMFQMAEIYAATGTRPDNISWFSRQDAQLFRSVRRFLDPLSMIRADDPRIRGLSYREARKLFPRAYGVDSDDPDQAAADRDASIWSRLSAEGPFEASPNLVSLRGGQQFRGGSGAIRTASEANALAAIHRSILSTGTEQLAELKRQTQLLTTIAGKPAGRAGVQGRVPRSATV